MNIYDNIAFTYDSMRSTVGVMDILHEVDTLGAEIKVLDLGCGTGHPIAKAIAPIVNEYFGIDSSQPMLNTFMKNIPNGNCNLLDMSIIDQISGKYHLIFSWGALCHLPIDLQKKTMTVVSTLLHPGGRFLFTGGKETGECTGKVGKYTVYHYSMGRSGYTEFLEQQGLEFISANLSEGGFYVYRFRKRTRQ